MIPSQISATMPATEQQVTHNPLSVNQYIPVWHRMLYNVSSVHTCVAQNAIQRIFSTYLCGTECYTTHLQYIPVWHRMLYNISWRWPLKQQRTMDGGEEAGAQVVVEVSVLAHVIHSLPFIVRHSLLDHLCCQVFFSHLTPSKLKQIHIYYTQSKTTSDYIKGNPSSQIL